ncbi:hypothetical protein KP509_32G044600 [Ceratopteris richardii]|uniref:N-acetyltransferase domain-containing protein n=1 Tax=Ceratopteris richardii TaxID=49495 RepID=A0A8T2QV15_CERRI|nr:hypothetical protein KP509_32G044600 [Ceratopteris richardii]
MSMLGLRPLLSSSHRDPQEPIGLRSAFLHNAFSSCRELAEPCHWRIKLADFAVLQSCCTCSSLPKGSSLKLQKAEIEDIGILGLELKRPYVIPYGNYIVQEAVLDEEFWAAAWLRAEIYAEGQTYFRYIDSYRKKFAEQEFSALKRRCSEKPGQSMKCICLLAVASEGIQDDIGMISQLTLRDRVIGTLDVSVRQLVRGEAFSKEVVTASLFTFMEHERKCGYIANVCVARSARRQGVASNLLEVAIKAAKSWKLKDLYVHVANDNTAARCLYMKTGFQVVEETAAPLRQEQLLYMCI